MYLLNGILDTLQVVLSYYKIGWTFITETSTSGSGKYISFWHPLKKNVLIKKIKGMDETKSVYS